MSQQDLLLSLSGGETSEFMRRVVMSPLSTYIYKYRKIHLVFMNTGLEDPETINFLKRIQDLAKQEIVVLESMPRIGLRKSSWFKQVTLDTVDMDGAPMERVIAKYGLPSAKSYWHCTRETKSRPCQNWAKENLSDKYVTAIGIREDESDRMDAEQTKKRYIYPLVRYQIRKEYVKQYFSKQDFRLNLPEHLGNCQTCFKKSDKKLSMVYAHNPRLFDFWKRMEATYGHLKDPRKIFRQQRSTTEMIEIFNSGSPLGEEANGCGGNDSCEAF